QGVALCSSATATFSNRLLFTDHLFARVRERLIVEQMQKPVLLRAVVAAHHPVPQHSYASAIAVCERMQILVERMNTPRRLAARFAQQRVEFIDDGWTTGRRHMVADSDVQPRELAQN